MRIPARPALFFVLVCVLACGEAAVQEANTSPAPLDPNAGGQLPAGHPPLDPASSPAPAPDMRVAQPPAGSGTGAAGLRWDTPEGWTSVQPTSSMRRAQYVVAGAGGDAECVAYYFGPGQGGGAEANAARWADQFAQPDGSSSRQAMKTREIELDGFEVLMVDVAGTYSGGMGMMGGANRALANYRLLGAIAEGPDANWFFKFTGPAATVAAQEQAFEAMIRSLRRADGV